MNTNKQGFLKAALDALELTTPYDENRLRRHFKRMALKYHPDRGGDKAQFDFIASCYKFLYQHLQYTTESEFEVMKSRALSAASSKSTQPTPHLRTDVLSSKTDNSFQERFNAFYEANRPESENDHGYKDFIEEPSVRVDNTHTIVKYVEPTSCTTKGMAYTVLGGSLEEYSGENRSMQQLHFSDYKYAHTCDKLIDETKLQHRKSFENVDLLQRYRDSENMEPTDSEKRHEKSILRKHEKDELKRLERLKQRDAMLAEHFSRVNTLQIV